MPIRTSKIKRYQKNLEKLKKLRSGPDTYNERDEKVVLDLMSVIWESLSVAERDYFKDTNHLSWPPPVSIEEEEEE